MKDINSFLQFQSLLYEKEIILGFIVGTLKK